MAASSSDRGEFGSSFGFIMAAAGSAVGLGNIWRFPYITGQNGGGAFVFVYILCVVLIGAPLIFNEIGLGRFTGKNPIGAFRDTKGSAFWIAGGAVLALCVSFFVLTYYSVIAGWTVGYIFKTLAGGAMSFTDFAAEPLYVLPLTAVFLVITVLIVLGGVSGGIEKASKILMPLLFALVFLVILRSVTLEGAAAGLEYYLKPDFSKITFATVLAALGQAFFSMSIGWGIMITYGSYLPKSTNIITSGLWVGGMDAGVAIMGGLMVFPAVFAFGKDPASGPALVFEVLPDVFKMMPGGALFGAIFFLLLAIAALTSAISMLEVPASWLIDEKKWSRKKAAWVVGILTFIVGVPSALSHGGSEFWTNISMPQFGGAPLVGFFSIMDYYFGTLFIVVVALMTALYTGWIMNIQDLITEINSGSPIFQKKTMFGFTYSQLWAFFIKIICPLVIVAVLLNTIGAF